MRAVGYVRVSTEDQAQNGVSLDDQEARVRSYIHSRGFEEVQIFREEGVSAKIPLGKRPRGAEMIEILRRKVGKGQGAEIQHIVAVRLDRLFRNTVNALEHAQAWDRTGIALHVLDMGGSALDTSSPMGRMFFTMAAAFGEMERRLIGARVKAGLDRLKAQGKTWVRKTPFGFDRIDRREIGPDGKEKITHDLVPNPEEMEIVRFIQSTIGTVQNGKWMTPGKVAKILTERGAKTKLGGKWHPVTIREILRVHEELAKSGSLPEKPETSLQEPTGRAGEPSDEG